MYVQCEGEVLLARHEGMWESWGTAPLYDKIGPNIGCLIPGKEPSYSFNRGLDGPPGLV
jgi:hypothetical protein